MGGTPTNLYYSFIVKFSTVVEISSVVIVDGGGPDDEENDFGVVGCSDCMELSVSDCVLL